MRGGEVQLRLQLHATCESLSAKGEKWKMENNRIDRPTTKRYKSGHRYVACVTRGGRQRAGPNGDSHDIRHFPQDPKGHPLAASRVLHKILINVTTKWWEPHWPRQIYGLHFDECAGKVFKAWRKLKFLVPFPQGAPNIFLLILAWKPPWNNSLNH